MSKIEDDNHDNNTNPDNNDEDIQNFAIKHFLNYYDTDMLYGVDDLIHILAKCFFVKCVNKDDVSTSTETSVINRCEDSILHCIEASKRFSLSNQEEYMVDHTTTILHLECIPVEVKS